MHPDELEEIEFQLNARADYLSEAFGREARLLSAQMVDDTARECGFTYNRTYQMACKEFYARQRARQSILKNHPGHVIENEVPF